MTELKTYNGYRILALVVLGIVTADLLFENSIIVPALYIFLPVVFRDALSDVKPIVFRSIVILLLLGPWFIAFGTHKNPPLVELFERLLIVGFFIVSRRVTAPMVRSNAQLEALWDSIVDGLIVIDNKAIIQSVNPSVTDMFGYTSDELVGQNIKMLMPSQYADNHDQFVSDYNDTGQAKVIGIGREVAGKRKNGDIFPLYLAVNRFKSGGHVFYGGIVRDQTEEKRVEAALIAAKEQAEAASQAKSTFLNNVSHEVRTPLNAILGFAQIAEMDIKAKINPDLLSTIEQIQISGEHLLALINDILDLANIESGNLLIDLAVIEAKTAVMSSIDMVRPLAQKHNVKIVMVEPKKDYFIKADKTRLTQAMVNLLTNAVKYNRFGGSVTVRMTVPKAGIVRIQVTDTGSGILTQDFNKLFQPFNRLGREALSIEGSGIGLSVTKSIMTAMGGSVNFKSKIGEGSDFWLDIPAEVSMGRYAAEAEPVVQSQREAKTSNKKDHALKVLYIEDTDSNTLLMTKVMQHLEGVELITRGTAEEGIAYALVNNINVILMDLNLPMMDGFEAFKALRSVDSTKNIPIIAISADVHDETIRRVKSEGFDAFIPKPFRVDDVKHKLHDIFYSKA